MIKGGKKKEVITKEILMQHVSAYDIYRYYVGPFKLNKVMVNSFRGEKDPSLVIGDKFGQDVQHRDLGDYSWRGDAIQFVQQIHSNCDMVTAMKIINKDLNLGLGGDIKVPDRVVITWEKPEIEIKTPPVIQVVYYARMTKSYLDYWAKLGQGESDLKREGIYQPKEIWRNRRKLALGDLMTFVYKYETIDKWKIYRPFAPKRGLNTPINQWKWDSNVPFNHVDNLGYIQPNCSKVLMAKSKKDRMVLMTALQTDCIADVQAEDPGAVTDDVLKLYEQVPNRWIVSDNDKKGKEFSWWLTKEHGFRHVNVPDQYLQGDPKCTDFADLCYHYGMDKVIEHFKQKGVI